MFLNWTKNQDKYTREKHCSNVNDIYVYFYIIKTHNDTYD